MNYKKYTLLLLAIIASFFLDQIARDLAQSIQNPLFDLVMTIISYEITVFFVLIIVASVFLYEERKKKQIKALFLSFFIALIAAFALKLFFMRIRPMGMTYFDLNLIGFFFAIPDYGFPSMHSAIAFSVLPVLDKEVKKLRTFWIIFASGIAFSRIYLNHHYFSDVVAGAILGYLIGEFVQEIIDSEILKKIHFTTQETIRSITHILLGTTMVLLLNTRIIQTKLLIASMLAILILALTLSLICKYGQPKLILSYLRLFEKPAEINTFPGKGAIYYFIGALICISFFSIPAASAAIMILAIGDPVAKFIGKYVGKIKLPFNKTKTLEGLIGGTIFATFAAMIFIPPYYALLVSSIGMTIESISADHLNLDDNIIVPLACALITAILLA